jgi:hypothetical protein
MLTCTVCHKVGWPDCGHLEGMPGPTKVHRIILNRKGREGEPWCNACDIPVDGNRCPHDTTRTEEEADAEALADFEGEEGITYRKRGRPKLPPDMKRREKLVVSFTGTELKAMMHAAADAPDGPLRLQDWARDVLIAASSKKEEKP